MRRPPLSTLTDTLFPDTALFRSSQIIVQGRMHGTTDTRGYLARKAELWPFVADSFARLQADADFVIVEGAGSPAEVNLRANDIANMGFARRTNVQIGRAHV